MAFEVPPLPYAYEALEPYIDSQTMHLHHDKHHQAYVDNFNAAIQKAPELNGKSAEDILRNLGSVPESLSLDRPQKEGRRVVFLAEFRVRSEPQPVKRFIRLQKWGTWEHLDEGKDLLQSIRESDEYTDYCLDRRLGCRQLGMNLPVTRVHKVGAPRGARKYRRRHLRGG